MRIRRALFFTISLPLFCVSAERGRGYNKKTRRGLLMNDLKKNNKEISINEFDENGDNIFGKIIHEYIKA